MSYYYAEQTPTPSNPEISISVAVDGHVTVVRFSGAYPPVVAGYGMIAAQPQIQSLGEGSTGQTELSRGRLAELSIEIPTPSEARRIAEILEVVDDHAEALVSESRKLVALRDALLPPLISGELRVGDAEALVEEAV